jgi:hypothetical protein
VQGTVQHSVAVDRRGSIVVASTTHLSQISSNGKLSWALRLRSSPAATGPVLTSDGRRLVATESELLSADADGQILWRRDLPSSGSGAPAPLLPTSDGGCTVPVGAHLFRMEPDGTVRDHAHVGEAILDVLGQGSSLVILTRSGAVLRWSPPADPNPLGSLGGPPTGGAALAAEQVLVAVVDSRRLVEFHLATGQRRVRVGEGRLMLDGQPAVTLRRETRVATLDGLLLGHDSAGKETLRVALAPRVSAGDGGVRVARSSRAPPLIVDSRGQVGFVRPGMDVGVVSADGKLSTAAGAACISAAGLVPAGRGRMAVACRSGIIWLVGD